MQTSSVLQLEESLSRRLWNNFRENVRVARRALWRNKAGLIGFIGLVFFLLLTFVGPLVVPFDSKVRVDRVYEPPSAEFPLGTNNQGQSIFSHIIHGGRELLLTAFVAGFLSTIIAVSFGSLAAFAGGAVDAIIVAAANFVLTVPQFPLLVVLAATVKFESPMALAVILALLNWPALLRSIRAQVLSLRARDYIEAAVALDLSTPHILFRELLPNMMSFITISFIFATTGAIYAQVGLVFLGLVPFAKQNWGVMISLAWTGGAIFYPNASSWILSPVLAISLFQLSMVMFARSLEEFFNPRLRTGL